MVGAKNLNVNCISSVSHDFISNYSNAVARRAKAKRYSEFCNFSARLSLHLSLTFARCAREQHSPSFYRGSNPWSPSLRAKIRGDQYSGRRYEPRIGDGDNYQHGSYVSCSMVIIMTKRGAENCWSYLRLQSLFVAF